MVGTGGTSPFGAMALILKGYVWGRTVMQLPVKVWDKREFKTYLMMSVYPL